MKKSPARFLWQPGDVKVVPPPGKVIEDQWTKYGKAKKSG
jgi:hypothetical protein